MKKILLCIFLVSTIYSENIFVSCEGNFDGPGGGSLWNIKDGELYNHLDNIGHVVQSIYIYENQLYVIINGSSSIEIFDITEDALILTNSINTNSSGPREMIKYNNYIYFTNWYSEDVKKLNLNTLEIEVSISMPGLPEDILFHNNSIYTTITMNHDWSDGNQVVIIDPQTDTIKNILEVGLGPNELIEFNNDIYISRTYYDENWNATYGTSKISGLSDNNFTVEIVDYNMGTICGGGILKYQNSVYRVYDGGIAKIDENLHILSDTKLGTYNPSEIYSVKILDNKIYFGLTDYTYPDYVDVINSNGTLINHYEVGVFPGDFAIWNTCISNGDINTDQVININDIILSVDLILEQAYNCNADLTNDGQLNVLDILNIIDIILYNNE